MAITKPTVLALDFEGTLISTVMTRIPRPGLWDFLNHCCELFPRLVIYTAVSEDQFRSVAKHLVELGFAPDWFSDIQYIQGQGMIKDLRFIKGVKLEDVLLIDDCEHVVHKAQKSQWLSIKCFDPPDSEDHNDLSKTLELLKARLAQSGDLAAFK